MYIFLKEPMLEKFYLNLLKKNIRVNVEPVQHHKVEVSLKLIGKE